MTKVNNMDDSNVTFTETIEWSAIETEKRSGRQKGLSAFYLVMASVVVLVLVIFIIYLVSLDTEDGKNGITNKETGALEMLENASHHDDETYESEHYTEPEEIYETDNYNDHDGYIDPINITNSLGPRSSSAVEQTA